jgi:hypothetical protein
MKYAKRARQVALIAVSAAIIYILSIGPVIRLVGYPNKGPSGMTNSQNAVVIFYIPLLEVASWNHYLDAALTWYMHLWVPEFRNNPEDYLDSN